LNRFAKLMRSTLENSEKLKINLKDSIEYLTNYVEIEKLRFKEDFDFEISFEGEEAPELLQVPPMLIQPFVENAIIHGLVPSQKTKMLKIEFIEEDNFLVCKIKDNGKGFETETQNKTHNSKGLKMIQTYFDLWNVQKNEKASFSIQSQVGEGTEVLIQIPI
ncbi:MAG: sensor histidine kinase, partial [Raineya sp.]